VSADARPAEALHRRILADRGRRVLADTVSEAELIARYKVPRSLLSRVLIRIHGEGFIERRRGHGWEWLPLLDTPEAIAESSRFRAILESAGLLEPGFKADLGEVAALRERHRRVVANKGRGYDASEFWEMNTRFHEMIAGFSGNRFLLQAIEQIDRLRKFQEFATFTPSSEALLESCREHIAILDAIEAGDRDVGGGPHAAPPAGRGRARARLRPQGGVRIRFRESTPVRAVAIVDDIAHAAAAA
jgi:DNA-binding GntR family transcriptional regulator